MSGMQRQLELVDAHMLAAPVRQVLGRSTATVGDWSYWPLTGHAINPVTAGIYGFQGSARDGSQELAWSLILKVIHWVDLSGTPLEQNYMNEPPDWNYWKREALAYQSGVLRGCRGNLVPAECYGVVEQADDSAWLWLENVTETGGSAWSLDRHVLAARHFGEFNGAHLARHIPGYPWLCKGFMRQWVTTFLRLGSMEPVQNPAVWHHPRVKRAFPLSLAGQLIRLVQDSDLLLAHLEQLPQTMSHHDTHRPNLFARTNDSVQDQTVVIDWSFLGLSAVGEDLGNQISGNLYNLAVEPSLARRYYERALQAYMEGLRAAGWRGQPEAVRFACATAASLRFPLFAARHLRSLAGPEERTFADDLAERHGGSIEEVLQRWGEALRFLIGLADEARDLLGRI
jgi:hypothetical protein